MEVKERARVELTVCERCGCLFRAAPGVHVCPRCNPPPVVRPLVDLDQFGDGDAARRCPKCGRRYFGRCHLCMRCLARPDKCERTCRHCGRTFMAPSKHFLMCPECRRKRRLAAYMAEYMPRWREARKTTCNGGSLASRKDGQF